MSGHTKGPWTMQTVQTSCGVCHKIGPFPGKREGDGPRHACLYADYPSLSNPSDAEIEANARLIAAAPELLDFARALSHGLRMGYAADELLRDGGSLRARLDAAIAKATGEQS